MIQHDRPIVLYNCDKKEKIGVFKYISLASRYLYNGKFNTSCTTKVGKSLRNKSRIVDSIFDFKVTARFADPNDVSLLVNKDFFIMNGYYIPYENQMKGLTARVQKRDELKLTNTPTPVTTNNQ